jgi:hypothetical protein
MQRQTTPPLTFLEIVTALIVVLVFALARRQWPQLDY